MDCKKDKRNDTSNRRVPWNHMAVIQRILGNVMGQREVKKWQKTAVVSTAHVTREVRMQKYKTCNMRGNIMYTINCNYRIAATVLICILEELLASVV